MIYLIGHDSIRVPCRWIDDQPFIKGVSFGRGKKIVIPLPEPIENTLKHLNPNSEDHGPSIPDYLKGRIPLFFIKLLDAIKESGVHYIDSYSATLFDPDNNQKYTTHRAVNILNTLPKEVIGRKSSEEILTDPKIDHKLLARYEKLPSIFYIKDAIGLFVNDKMKDYLLGKGFDSLKFSEINDVAL